MGSCIKPEAISECDSMAKLAKFNTKDKDKHLPIKKVDLGFYTKGTLTKAVAEKFITERQVLDFRSDCREFFLSLLGKLIQRCPLGYPLARSAAALDPVCIATDLDKSVKLFSRLLEILQKLNANILAPSSCDSALKQYRSFVATMNLENKHEFKHYNCKTIRLDEFLMKFVPEDQLELKKVIIIVLTLSHGPGCRKQSQSRKPETETIFALETETKIKFGCKKKNDA